MISFSNIQAALGHFTDSAQKHAAATEAGNYRTGNKHHDRIIAAFAFLKDAGALDLLVPLLDHSSVGVRSWAARYLLQVHEEKAVQALEEIAGTSGIHAGNAKTCLGEWQKGHLTF
jgi:HEAT repeat protein